MFFDHFAWPMPILAAFSCTRDTFIPVDTARVRWLMMDVDYELAPDYWQKYQSPLSYETWAAAHSFGYKIATAKSIGFQIIPPEEVWWTYPRLPDL